MIFAVLLGLAACSKRTDDFPKPVLIDAAPSPVALAASIRGTPAETDEQIRIRLVAQSHSSYDGRCACPYDHGFLGRRCGVRSAYNKGVAVLCYRSDVTPEMIASYRAKVIASAHRPMTTAGIR